MRILISGYYGFGNLGDEAILAAIVQGLRTRLPEAELIVLTGSPAQTAQQYRVQVADRWRSAEIWKEMRAADFFLQGGGGLLQDTTSAHSAYYYLGLLHLARLARTPYMIFAQGIGPLQSSFLRGLTARNLCRAAAITVRDEESATTLREWGVTRPAIEVTADPALLLQPSPPEYQQQLLRQLDLPADQPYIAISLRDWPGLEEFLPHLVALLQRREEELLVLPFQYDRDLPLALELSRALPNRVHLPLSSLNPADCLSLIQGARAVIGMRLHAVVFAASQATPVVALSYDPKVDAFCRRSGHRVLQLPEATCTRLHESLEECLQDQSDVHSQARLENLRHAAALNFDILTRQLAQCRERK
jgi:polysaccharide pyruvyl transferase CsaB